MVTKRLEIFLYQINIKYNAKGYTFDLAQNMINQCGPDIEERFLVAPDSDQNLNFISLTNNQILFKSKEKIN